MMLTSLSACSVGVSSGWEWAVGTGAGFFDGESEEAFFCLFEGTLDVIPEVALEEWP